LILLAFFCNDGPLRERIRESKIMRYICDLSAEHCDLAWLVVNAAPGDALELHAHESQRFIAHLVAESTRNHLKTMGKGVDVILQLRSDSGEFGSPEGPKQPRSPGGTSPILGLW
jgi:hypothetical protein